MLTHVNKLTLSNTVTVTPVQTDEWCFMLLHVNKLTLSNTDTVTPVQTDECTVAC